LDLSPEVAAALAAGEPVVALESSVIAQGLPPPHNVETATRLEGIVRASGATPATIAVVDGRLKVGASAREIERLGTAPEVAKASLRDLPYLLTKGRSAGTTVAATVRIAALAGIDVFATGGIGGVHRGATATFDVSADLQEIARSSVVVVCAGAKSILDIGLTLEVLETLSVPVVVYGSDAFPAFYSRESGFAAPKRLDDPDAIARLLRRQRDLGISAGLVIANPISPADEIPLREIEPALAGALAEARAAGISGQDTTPFLLRRLAEITGGRSLGANIALLERNARLGAHIARALATVGRGP
jgi:pseudouridine-5'-phosphate glycosidase